MACTLEKYLFVFLLYHLYSSCCNPGINCKPHMSGCDADVASLVRQAIYDANQSTIEDEDIFDYLVSVISDDTFEFGENAENAHDTLGPLLVRFSLILIR